MTWPFDNEIHAHRQGWIDLFGFVSTYQMSILRPQLESVRPVRELEGYRPYFNPENRAQNLRFEYREPTDYYGIGRISRDDANKYPEDMWRMFQKVCAPLPTKTFILGYGPNAYSRTGPAPSGLDWQTWLPGEIPVGSFYDKLHCLIHKTGGSRESYCRIVPEAYACGVPIVVEDDFAFPELVVDGVTGFRCRTSDEMSFRASQLAFDESMRKRIIIKARDYLFNEISSLDRCWTVWQALL